MNLKFTELRNAQAVIFSAIVKSSHMQQWNMADIWDAVFHTDFQFLVKTLWGLDYNSHITKHLSVKVL